jgi:hypothetical protein
MLLSTVVDGEAFVEHSSTRRAAMPHLKCEACRVRVHAARYATDLTPPRCPVCAGALEPVGALTEIVGFRAVELPSETAGPGAGHQRLAEEVAKVMARRRAAASRAWREVNRGAP